MISACLERLLFAFAVTCLLLGHPLSSFAGYRDDRLVVWVNLESGSKGFNVDEVIRDFIHSGRVDSSCGVRWQQWGSTLYMKKRPDGITDDLIRKAFIEKDRPSLQRLNHLLKSFKDPEIGADEGLDGVVVYSSKGGPHMMNFITGRKKIKSYSLASNNSLVKAQDVEEAFCVLLPPTTRAP